MKITEIITELFNKSTVPWEWKFRGSEEAFARFTINGVPYRFYAYSRGDANVWEVEFSAVKSNGLGNEYDITGTGSAALVMSTVVDILRSFLLEYKDKILQLKFEANEVSRQDLYARMVQRLLPNWEMTRFYNGEQFVLTHPDLEAMQQAAMNRNTNESADQEYPPRKLVSKPVRKSTLTISQFTQNFMDEHGVGVRELLHGLCEDFADEFIDEFGGTMYVTHDEDSRFGNYYHFFMQLGNKFYDGGTPNGVSSWRALSSIKPYFVNEAVNTRGFIAGFKKTKPILNGEFTLVATPGHIGYGVPVHGATSDKFRIVALTNDGDQVGIVDFVRTDDEDSDYIYADSVTVQSNYQRMGIASEMYKFARELGNDIQPATKQTAMGRDFWSKTDHSAK